MVSKLLGYFPDWYDRLLVARESGYNMVHLTPSQTLGISNSSYCLKDQLSLSPNFTSPGGERNFTYDDVKGLVDRLKREHVLMVSDLVWNHTAKNSDFLRDHPECSFNLDNSPRSRPAWFLDRALHYFSIEISRGDWADCGVYPVVDKDEHLEAIRQLLYDEVLTPLKLHELFQVKVEKIVEQFKSVYDTSDGAAAAIVEGGKLKIVKDKFFRRLHSVGDINLALKQLKIPSFNKQQTVEAFCRILIDLNNEAAERCWGTLEAAVNAVMGRVRYERLEGPRYGAITDKYPLLCDYFTNYGQESWQADAGSWQAEEAWMYDAKVNKYLMANNGWVMNDDPLKNFAEYPSMVYVRRELICWADNVKLRHGKGPEDCPYLWQHMREYTELTARTFHGVRLDNCHSTPVAEYLLTAARKVRPELFVIAELFTGAEELDNIFVNRLGITSLIREAQSAGDSHEQGRLVYKYGGDPVGAFMQAATRPLRPMTAHTLFIDHESHDNPSPIQTRACEDLLPTAAMLSMAACGSASTRGYDELIPHQINIVNETRLYPAWSDQIPSPPGTVGPKTGMISGKRLVNELHFYLGRQGYSQVFVDQVNEDVVAITRHNPKTHQSVILVAHTAFSQGVFHKRMNFIKPLKIDGHVESVLFETRLKHRTKEPTTPQDPKTEEQFLIGLRNYAVHIQQNVKPFAAKFVEVHQDETSGDEVDFTKFKPGSVVALRVSIAKEARTAIDTIREGLAQFGYRRGKLSGGSSKRGVKIGDDKSIAGIAKRMSLLDLNMALFRCHEEEAEEGKGGSAYEIPVFGRLVYCGLYGFIHQLDEIRLKNDLGHPFCGNLRGGDWMLTFISDRLLQDHGTKELGMWFSDIFAELSKVPHYLKPCYFDAILPGAYEVLVSALFAKMSTFIQDGSPFVKSLAMTSVELVGAAGPGMMRPCHSISPLPSLTRVVPETGAKEAVPPSLSAGLPHFSTGIFRNWGRDTFCAMPGLILISGRWDEARNIILSYGATIRHGLIPNLLGGGTHARYNCWDAVWWWLKCTRLHTIHVPDGVNILRDLVIRMYPKDEDEPTYTKDTQVIALIYDALKRHFTGLSYRERNAGRQIDEHMRDEGFTVTIGMGFTTGFVHGGNQWNGGTWMDKIGSSDKAGNRDVPATPRDGSAVELVGLSYAVLRARESA